MKHQAVTVSVPGKVLLMGDHAIVYGYPALLAAVGMRTRVTVLPRPAGAPGDITVRSAEPDGYIRHIIGVTRNLLGIKRIPALTVTVESDIPPGYHLGSSAAVAVAAVAACMYSWKSVWNPAEINRIAYEAEKHMHGNPSGGDNTAVTFGGLIWFRKELEFLRSIWQLPFRIPDRLNRFLLIDTGRPAESTGEMVAFVSSKLKAQNSKFKRIFARNEEQTRNITVALKTGKLDGLLSAVRAGEGTLEEMGVVSARVIPLIRAAEAAGGAAKILGGGGRKRGVGYILACHRDPDRIAALSRKFGYPALPVRLGEEGVRLEKESG
ncbi:hypothetical protein A2Z33_07570 [Candidatus Gottesmanbacteria bacterium RBG_16_52_11]|uniref:GHMP kinase N-terminal domain-containing protein n=1 Tax=Candidatus Gottesmanbacteria bacterium RBG_16_52_11 TaxID=1798374 RepID=A0A1F5YN35_9BACT|nr:MAG: hypothetical protein A2Z33_07570 [Candidatus Gottesmanbacteria bacterium RBG_16_52_11]